MKKIGIGILGVVSFVFTGISFISLIVFFLISFFSRGNVFYTHESFEAPYLFVEDFVVGNDGDLYILNYYYDLIMKYDKNGNFIESYNTIVNKGKVLLAIDENEKLYQIDKRFFFRKYNFSAEHIIDKSFKERNLKLILNDDGFFQREYFDKEKESLYFNRQRKIVKKGEIIFELPDYKIRGNVRNPFTDKDGNEYFYKGPIDGIVKYSKDGKVLATFKQPIWKKLFAVPMPAIFFFIFGILMLFSAVHLEKEEQSKTSKKK